MFVFSDMKGLSGLQGHGLFLKLHNDSMNYKFIYCVQQNWIQISINHGVKWFVWNYLSVNDILI